MQRKGHFTLKIGIKVFLVVLISLQRGILFIHGRLWKVGLRH